MSGAANNEDRARLVENKLRPNILEGGYAPSDRFVLMTHTQDRISRENTDVKQNVMRKEDAPEDNSPSADPQDPSPPPLKEEQEEVCISLDDKQFNVKEETEAIRLPVTAISIKIVDDEQSLLPSQLYHDQTKTRQLPEENDGEESIRTQDNKDCSISFETEYIVKDEEDSDVEQPISELKHLPDSGLKTEDMDNDCKDGRAPKSDGDIVDKPFSSSEFAEQLDQHCSFQKQETDSETGSSSSMDDDSFTEKKNVDSQRKAQTEGKTSCEDCGKTFIRKHSLSRHMRTHTGHKPFGCDLCRERFGQKSDLNKHMRTHTGQKPFRCDLCGKRFSQKGNLNIHMGIHTGQKPFCCDFCVQRFRQKSHLNTHMRIHTGQKPFCCDFCGLRFSQKGSLNTHLRIHTGQKPFCCDVCGLRFANNSNLKTHITIHTGQKPFRCDLCGQRFGHKSHLNKHSRIHTGQKPFRCDLCGQRFADNSNLNTHMRIHTGKKPFSCDQCGKKFSYKSYLKRHTRTHTGLKPFCCDLCEQRFANKSSLNTHMKIHGDGKKV